MERNLKTSERLRDYDSIDQQINRAKAWLQRRLMGLRPAEEDQELRENNPYLSWAIGEYWPDLNLLASEILSRESRNRDCELVLDRSLQIQSNEELFNSLGKELICA